MHYGVRLLKSIGDIQPACEDRLCMKPRTPLRCIRFPMLPSLYGNICWYVERRLSVYGDFTRSCIGATSPCKSAHFRSIDQAARDPTKLGEDTQLRLTGRIWIFGINGVQHLSKVSRFTGVL